MVVLPDQKQPKITPFSAIIHGNTLNHEDSDWYLGAGGEGGLHFLEESTVGPWSLSEGHLGVGVLCMAVGFVALGQSVASIDDTI